MAEENDIYRDGLSVYFYDQINQSSAIKLIQELTLAQEHSASMYSSLGIFPKIKLHINSNGGTVKDSFSISNFIKNNIKIPIDTYVDSFCASGATFISLSGNTRYMNKNSLILIHQLSGGLWGNHEKMKGDVKMQKVEMDMMRDFYINHTSIKKKRLNKILKKDQWLDYKFCLKYNLVDEVLGLGD